MILVVGQAGMGREMLINEFKRRAVTLGSNVVFAEQEACGAEPIEAAFASLSLSLFRKLEVVEGSFDKTERNARRWHGLLSLMSALPTFGGVKQIADYYKSIRDLNQLELQSRERLISTLNIISGRLRKEDRRVIVFTRRTLTPADHEDPWAWVARNMPPRVYFVFRVLPHDPLNS